MCLVWEVNVIFTPIHLHIVPAELLLCVDPLEQREDPKQKRLHIYYPYFYIVELFGGFFSQKDFFLPPQGGTVSYNIHFTPNQKGA